MTDPFAEEKKRYNNQVKAEAQFYRTDRGSRPSIRLMLPSIGLEFSDGHFIGPDPQGVFCFNNFSDFPSDVWSRYEAKTTKQDGKVYLRIQFFSRNGRDIFSEFFAIDHDNLAEKSGIVGNIRDGRWIETDFGSATAHVKKLKGECRVAITVQSISWNAEFNADDDQLKQQHLDVSGHLRFKHQGDISLGVFVRWNTDHLIFYGNNRNSRDYIAYFIPTLYDPSAAPINLGGVDKVFQNVQWTSIRPGSTRA